ncbi:Leukotriene A-4 hydrolase [Paragonimus heterotremus]|uniref:Leukotriene A-4 hydrolase n=1 Tax=Paragonimus heterotremus TaxID=100268 RepID=A0A8J4WFN1_9TREM|nr:Leukotriene A-4 hydrolase [Paragonimus heterotremus]
MVMVHTHDPSSSSEPKHHITKHLKFDWTVNFSDSTISGTVVLCIQNVSVAGSDHPLVLDVNNLDIKTVKVSDEPVQWKITPNPTEALGSRLEITVPTTATEFLVEITYRTSPSSTALQWLDSDQTADRRLPFMFSQCQAIHARSLFPCQDTPGVKSSFEAVVHVPKDIVAVMGAVRVKDPSSSPRGDTWKEYHFEQTVPIPSYLVTIACGDLASKRIGPRSSVWAEPSVVERAAEEFAETEKMIVAGEELCGPYIWKNYDILVLPPTFPYGGMENPCLTFVSPTVLAGDRSLVNVIAHEIAHSWTGNLVTNSSWEHFWLNEGHTMYLERLIMEKLHGTQMRHLLLAIGYAELIIVCEDLGPKNPFSKLVPNLDGVDPDVSYNRIPYEKGSLFLCFLEHTFGKDKMLSWLKAYVKQFAGKALDTTMWREFLASQLGPGVESDLVNWNEWLYGMGLPSWKPTFEAADAIAQCDQFNDLLASSALGETSSVTTASASMLKQWSSLTPVQRELALRRLNERKPLSHNNLQAIDSALHLSRQQNAELRFEWSIMTIRARYLPALDSCLEFLNSQGRMRYTRPLYRELNQWPEVRERVHENFKTQRPFMHRTTSMLVEKDLGLAV